MNEFTEQILRFRLKNNFTQQQLADKIGISKVTLNGIETEKKLPTKKTEIKIKMFMEEYKNEVETNN